MSIFIYFSCFLLYDVGLVYTVSFEKDNFYLGHIFVNKCIDETVPETLFSTESRPVLIISACHFRGKTNLNFT